MRPKRELKLSDSDIRDYIDGATGVRGLSVKYRCDKKIVLRNLQEIGDPRILWRIMNPLQGRPKVINTDHKQSRLKLLDSEAIKRMICDGRDAEYIGNELSVSDETICRFMRKNFCVYPAKPPRIKAMQNNKKKRESVKLKPTIHIAFRLMDQSRKAA